MILPRPLLGAVLLLLASSALSKGGRRCSVVEILQQYQAVLFDEIHSLKNLSSPAEAHRKHRSRAGPACRSNQERKILLSIYNMSTSLRAAASGSLHDPRELAAMKVASNTESMIRQHCRKIHKARQRSPPRPLAPGKQQLRRTGSSRKRQKELARTAESLLACWEKLYSLHSWG